MIRARAIAAVSVAFLGLAVPAMSDEAPAPAVQKNRVTLHVEGMT